MLRIDKSRSSAHIGQFLPGTPFEITDAEYLFQLLMACLAIQRALMAVTPSQRDVRRDGPQTAFYTPLEHHLHTCQVYRPRFLGHRFEPYATLAAG